MKIILKKEVPKVGSKHDIKNVSSGYALNFLIPHGLAEVATPEATKRAEEAKSKHVQLKKVHEDLLVKSLKSIDGVVVKVSGKTNEKGHLFAGIHKDGLIAEIAKQTNFEMLPEFVILEKPIKEIGEHAVTIKVGDKTATIKVVVEAK